ncbi:MAG TPA: adenylate/guanylate cyclase domain-containing protein [Candidatus Limnocylindrales bacterium]|nr:adenylate/guanylate cyclase domain-containing protein [Candidatus Limnocylindrales bacterium]
MPEERRLVTVLFADVVGSTSIGESNDPEDLRRLLSRFYQIAHQVVDDHAGTLEKFIGDAAMAIFGIPQAHDDDARRALDAALELRDRVRDDPQLGDLLPIRIGVNTGEVVASRDLGGGDFLVTGDAVNVAARLQQEAEPWQVLASTRTASAAGDAYAFGPSREMDLRGKGRAVSARQVIGPSAAKRPRVPLVGRDADVAQLELVARRAFTERRPYLVSVIAPAGTGKSRLVEEFLSRLDTVAPTSQVAIAQCLPYGQRLTYWPMRALLLDLIGLAEDQATPEAVRTRSRRWLEDAGADTPAETAELLAATIGASDADVEDRSAMFAAWRTALELAAADRPLVLIVEDLHWSSDSLLDLIEFILQPSADAPMLMLALTRPELLDRRPTWGGGRRNHVSLALEPLDEGSVERLVEHILDGPAPELIPIVVRRSEGNPFYAGEIVRSMIERGVDLHDPAAVAAAAAGLPDTVQATVLSRLDQLDPAARRVLQLGAVIGRSFTTDGLAALEPDLGDGLADAVDRLIERDMLRRAARGELLFRHILIREVAYGTLPRAERSVHHLAAGSWLESRSAGREDELAELIAYHYREAAVLAASGGVMDDRVRQRAIVWLRRASEVAATAHGTAEAVGHLRAAIELAPPDETPELHQRIGDIYGSGDLSAQAYADAYELGRRYGRSPDFLLDNLSQRLMVVCRWFASVARQLSWEEMARLIREGHDLAALDGDPRPRARFRIALGFLPFWLRNGGIRTPSQEDLDEAAASVAAGLEAAEALDDARLVSAALDAMTSTEQSMNPRKARIMSERRLAMGHRLPFDERLDALGMIAWTSALIGDLPEIDRAADEAMAAIEPGQNHGFALAGGSWRAYAAAMSGDWDRVVATVDFLRRLWIDVERPAASYLLQGVLSGIDWARNRGEEDHLERWLAVATDIVDRFEPRHPVAALVSVIRIEPDGLVELISQPDRYPDRPHYVEHAMALCADHGVPVPIAAVDVLIARAERSRMGLLEAQARRLRGVQERRDDDLAGSLEQFADLGAARYAARLRTELGALRGDQAMVDQGARALESMGELDELTRLRARRG